MLMSFVVHKGGDLSISKDNGCSGGEFLAYLGVVKRNNKRKVNISQNFDAE